MSEQTFPLSPTDSLGHVLSVGTRVRIESVASCVHDLPLEDQDHLCSLVGQVREIVQIDSYGFVWFAVDHAERSEDFCLFPREVVLDSPPSEGSNPTFQRTATRPLN
ncbi:hypothetical protein [Paralysiella testudinis]|uniref:Uncharacterized protein n=1 Tax=Paralysiella testudinis TaxID=2809020 RepID=A0A892ZCH2_9NEIS|nr:hypothetical protein [Paralysiella testudinis]QRQ80642.1 hypothetical protein JQU52_07625 [Paralysiella testudinis]